MLRCPGSGHEGGREEMECIEFVLCVLTLNMRGVGEQQSLDNSLK